MAPAAKGPKKAVRVTQVTEQVLSGADLHGRLVGAIGLTERDTVGHRVVADPVARRKGGLRGLPAARPRQLLPDHEERGPQLPLAEHPQDLMSRRMMGPVVESQGQTRHMPTGQ